MTDYEGSDIQVLEGRDAVRERPGMYIGGTSEAGLHHILWEIVDNSVDEFMNGHASEINVTLHEDGQTLTVRDDGRGIPVSIEETTGKSALEVVLTTLHAGAKFEAGSSYKGSGGLHGVGAAVTNFLSENMIARVYRNEEIHEITFDTGIPQKDVEVVGEYSKYSSNSSSGTEITFTADADIFDTVDYDPEYIAEMLEIKTYVNPGLSITFEDETQGNEHSFYHENGIQDYINELTEKKKTVHDEPVVINGNEDGLSFEIVFQWTEATSNTTLSFVNSIPTTEGGTHENGFRQGMSKAFDTFIETSDVVPARLEIKRDDIFEGLTTIINVFYEGEIQFQSQNKTRLNNREIKRPIAKRMKTQMEQFLFSHASTARAIGKRIVAAAKARRASRSAKKASASSGSNAKKLTLPGKLTDCSNNEPSECELFIVEGDSAGGNAKMARDRLSQAVLPLRGKVLNTENSSTSRIMKNKELSGIVEALGCGLGDSFNISNLRYHKIILLMDADSDGHHISTLLLTFFYRHMPELIEEGHIYLAKPPLYRVMHGNDRHWATTKQELDTLITNLKDKDARKNIDLARFKGLGEMMADTLGEVALDKESRDLIEVEIADAELADEIVTSLMGRKTSKRKAMIKENLNKRKKP